MNKEELLDKISELLYQIKDIHGIYVAIQDENETKLLLGGDLISIMYESMQDNPEIQKAYLMAFNMIKFNNPKRLN